MQKEAPIFLLLKKRKDKNSIRNDSLFLRLYKLVHKCTSSPIKHLPHMDLPRVKSGTNPCFQGSTSRTTSAPVHCSNTSHAWTIYVCNTEQLLVFRALRVGRRMHRSTSQTPPTHGQSMYAIQNNSSFLALRVDRRVHQFTS